jgi:hypothetical protein
MQLKYHEAAVVTKELLVFTFLRRRGQLEAYWPNRGVHSTLDGPPDPAQVSFGECAPTVGSHHHLWLKFHVVAKIHWWR